MNSIFFDNAATTLLDPQVVEAMLPYMTRNLDHSATHSYGRETKLADLPLPMMQLTVMKIVLPLIVPFKSYLLIKFYQPDPLY